MAQLGLQYMRFLHTVAVIYTTALVIFLITMALLYNSQRFFCLQFRYFTPGQHCLLFCVELNQAKKDLSRRETQDNAPISWV